MFYKELEEFNCLNIDFHFILNIYIYEFTFTRKKENFQKLEESKNVGIVKYTSVDWDC